VRLHGIDTPERSALRPEATSALVTLVLNRQVELEPCEQDGYEPLAARAFSIRSPDIANSLRVGKAQ
jgi:endonuclease YncB( thermonuclease family)